MEVEHLGARGETVERKPADGAQGGRRRARCISLLRNSGPVEGCRDADGVPVSRRRVVIGGRDLFRGIGGAIVAGAAAPRTLAYLATVDKGSAATIVFGQHECPPVRVERRHRGRPHPRAQPGDKSRPEEDSEVHAALTSHELDDLVGA